MTQLTLKQQRLLAELRRRAAHATAAAIEASWLRGEPTYLDHRGRGGKGLSSLFKKANRIRISQDRISQDRISQDRSSQDRSSQT